MELGQAALHGTANEGGLGHTAPLPPHVTGCLRGALWHSTSTAASHPFPHHIPLYRQEVTDPLNPGRTVPYVRYHLAKGELNELYRFCGLFSWIKGKYFTHECFLRLKGDWHMPKFFPTTGTTFPFSVFGYQGPCERFFYDFGIYIAPKGAITRLHIDGSRTHAVLFQVVYFATPTQCRFFAAPHANALLGFT